MKHVLFLSIVSTAFLLLSTVAGTSPASGNGGEPTSSSHVNLRSACSSTPHPDLCVSTVSAAAAGHGIESDKDIIAAVLNTSATVVKRNHFAMKIIARTSRSLLDSTKMAVDDCLEAFDLSLDDLDAAVESLRSSPNEKKLPRGQADDLNTLISSAMTYQDNCLSGFFNERADIIIRNAFWDSLREVERLCSIALSKIETMADTDIANSKLQDGTSTGPNIIKEVVEEVAGDGHVDGDEWPLWLSEEDRQLLQSESVKPDVVVAEDGSGDYTTVADAVEAAPSNSTKRYVIRIKTGVYEENVRVTGHRKNIMFVGDGRLHTFITGNRSAVSGWSAIQSATVGVISEGFLARDITFENTGGSGNGAAVALRVASDNSAFFRCGFSGYERTLHVQSKRQFFVDCLITGNRDIIYGNSAAFFQDCDIRVRQQFWFAENFVTAQFRSDPNQKTGIVIQNSRIEVADLKRWLHSTTYLGRAEREFARSVVMQSYISDLLLPEGWLAWAVGFDLDNFTFREYQNRGAGANTKGRVKWKSFKVITDPEEAKQFTAGPFVGGGRWLTGTGFPFKLGL